MVLKQKYIYENNRVASPPSRKMLFFKFKCIGIIVQLEFKQAHQLTFMIVIRQQELFSLHVVYFLPFLFKNRGPLLRRSDILHILIGTSQG